MYSNAQIKQYLEHISFPYADHPADPLELLTELQKRQLERVPFENLSLHYSPKRELSLDPDDLFHKIVSCGKGGYCLENNNFFGQVLRALGFDCIYASARVKQPPLDDQTSGWLGWSHLVNLVSINGQRHLVDVGHGSRGPTRPVPLAPDIIVDDIMGRKLRLEYKTLPQHHDPSQRMWVYSFRENDESPWLESYCFTEIESLATDFDMMNYFTMKSPESLFTQNVIAQRFLMDEGKSQLVGSVSLFRDRIKIDSSTTGFSEEIIKSESERVDAIERWFRIQLDATEKDAIIGSVSEIKVV
ncbi:hypothetical protein FZEAL_4562 [Fusarium zealandicum]|uniref:Arylamine N-acetyltransferase n=1 Tax=Fusarium zealandicum TaxID=1053134 RepID=A0A8H4UM87_9HYPO|nr:hypothetical protein FZEAL_4562 [Fusarium zealandicum]